MGLEGDHSGPSWKADIIGISLTCCLTMLASDWSVVLHVSLFFPLNLWFDVYLFSSFRFIFSYFSKTLGCIIRLLILYLSIFNMATFLLCTSLLVLFLPKFWYVLCWFPLDFGSSLWLQFSTGFLNFNLVPHFTVSVSSISKISLLWVRISIFLMSFCRGL